MARILGSMAATPEYMVRVISMQFKHASSGSSRPIVFLLADLPCFLNRVSWIVFALVVQKQSRPAISMLLMAFDTDWAALLAAAAEECDGRRPSC